MSAVTTRRDGHDFWVLLDGVHVLSCYAPTDVEPVVEMTERHIQVRDPGTETRKPGGIIARRQWSE